MRLYTVIHMPRANYTSNHSETQGSYRMANNNHHLYGDSYMEEELICATLVAMVVCSCSLAAVSSMQQYRH